MSDRYFQILKETDNTMNFIPSGQQLPRTPPLINVNRQLDFSSDNLEEAGTTDISTPETKRECISVSDDPHSMLKRMKGYQLVQSDWEFVEQLSEEKRVKKLQRDLEEVHRLLKGKKVAAELASADRERSPAGLSQFPSCEELAEFAKVVLRMTSPSTELTDLDNESLLAMVTKDNIQRVIEEKRVELSQMVASKNHEAKEGKQLEKQIASQQHKIQRMMSQLTDLKSKLTQEEEAFQDLEMQIKAQKAPVEAEKVDTSEELQATKSQRQGKKSKKAVKFTEKLEDTATNQSKSARSKLTDSKGNNQASVKGETLKPKQKSGAAAEKPMKPVKAARGPQKKVKEKSNPQESEQAVRRTRKAAGTAPATASQPKHQSQMKTGQKAAAAADDAGEEAPNAGLRRSKRIANRR